MSWERFVLSWELPGLSWELPGLSWELFFKCFKHFLELSWSVLGGRAGASLGAGAGAGAGGAGSRGLEAGAAKAFDPL